VLFLDEHIFDFLSVLYLIKIAKVRSRGVMNFAKRESAIIKYKICEIHLRYCLRCHPNFKNRGQTECSLRFRPLSLETQRGAGSDCGGGENSIKDLLDAFNAP